MGATTRNFTVNGPAFTSPALGDLVISAVITGTGTAGLTKLGNGVLELTGNSAFPGTTTITQGTLLADAPGGNTLAAVSINGGTLGGNGTVGPVTSTAVGGTIMGGDGLPIPPSILNIQTTNASPIATLNSATKFALVLYHAGDGPSNHGHRDRAGRLHRATSSRSTTPS